MDPQFKDMERLTDNTGKAVVELLNHTREYLQPNSRAGLQKGQK